MGGPSARHQPGRGATGSTTRARLVDGALAVVVVLGTIAALSATVVWGTLLDEDTYTDALVRADAFERTYTEVLADPELAGSVEELLGELRVGPRTAVQARTLATNALRLSLPPAALRDGTADGLASVLGYVRGDTDRLALDVDLTGLPRRIEDATVTRARTLLASAETRAVSTVEEYRARVDEAAEELARGLVPDSLPVLGGTAFDVDDVAEAIVATLPPDEAERLQTGIESAVAAGEQRSGLVEALGRRAADHAATTVESRFGRRGEPALDVVASIAERAGQREARVVASLDGARRAASWFRPAVALAAAAAALAAATALALRHRDRPHRGAVVVGLSLLVAGAATLVLWGTIAGSVAEPLDRAAGTGPGAWDLPPGLRGVLGDVRVEVASQVATAVWWRVGAALVAGGVLVGGSVLLRRAPTWPRTVRPGVVAVAVAGLAAVALVGLTAGPDLAEAEPLRACNGHVELCDRGYDEVVQGATHNSMSSPDVVQVWPEHDGDMRSQLDAGVRTLLIDTHYWTELETVRQLRDLDPDLPPALAERLVEAAARVDARDGTFLCHNHCAFGGKPFVEGLDSIRGFLEDNPHDVVTLIIQDAISPEDTAAAMTEAGLDPHLHTHRPDEAWPTLGTMIDDDRRLVVFAEEADGPYDWYANAFVAMKETPFLALSAEELSCRPNRGDEDADLFLMNHWIQRIAPDRVDSAEINQHDVIVDRARECEAERGQLPNYIAVNFSEIGDLREAVATLNGVG